MAGDGKPLSRHQSFHASCLHDVHSLILKALAVKAVRAARSDLAARSVPAMVDLSR
jgi:hypothetical protein